VGDQELELVGELSCHGEQRCQTHGSADQNLVEARRCSCGAAEVILAMESGRALYSGAGLSDPIPGDQYDELRDIAILLANTTTILPR